MQHHQHLHLHLGKRLRASLHLRSHQHGWRHEQRLRPRLHLHVVAVGVWPVLRLVRLLLFLLGHEPHDGDAAARTVCGRRQGTTCSAKMW